MRQKEDMAHAEAFCIMQYRCEKCHTVEKIWNSRDGVSPFMIDCVKCDGQAQHIDWQNDEFASSHEPKEGERIFITTPPHYVPEYMTKRRAAIKEKYPDSCPSDAEWKEILRTEELDVIQNQAPMTYVVGSFKLGE